MRSRVRVPSDTQKYFSQVVSSKNRVYIHFQTGWNCYNKRMSNKLWNSIVVSIFLNFAHMAEVIFSGYHKFGFQSLVRYFDNTSSAIYFSSHIPIYFFVLMFFLSHKYTQLFKFCLVAYGWIFISETHHFIRSIATQQYFPGSLTSFFYLILGVFYFYTLKNEWKKLA